MKKVLSLCLAMAMVFSLTACSGSGEGTETTAAAAETTAAAAEDETTAAADEERLLPRPQVVRVLSRSAASDLQLEALLYTELPWQTLQSWQFRRLTPQAVSTAIRLN